jgi:hypothetical protein
MSGPARLRPLLTAIALAALAGGCQEHMVREQANALTLRAGSVEHRQVQSRRYDTRDEAALLAAAAAVLQDLGYTIEETSVPAGLINASKDRGGTHIRASLVTRPSADRNGEIVRVTFQALNFNPFAGVSVPQTIDDAVIYQQFFDRLSQSIFLTGHDI